MWPRLVLALLAWPVVGSVQTMNDTHLINGSLLRSFSIYSQSITYEPIPDEEMDTENDSEDGSGFNAISKQHPAATVIKDISNETKGYLTSHWLTIVIPSVYTFVFSLSMPLNIMAIIMFLFRMKVKKPAVVYMLNLAMADVLFTSVLPFKVIYYFLGNDWAFGPGMCRFVTAAFYANMYCSVLLITSISVDRFLAVVYPMHSLSWRTRGRALLICLTVWIIATASTIPFLAVEQTMKIPSLNITTCHDVLDFDDQNQFYFYYFITFCSFFFFLPCAITIVCYVGIIRCLGATSTENKQKKTRALLLALIVFCVFIICFGPTNIILFTHYLRISVGPSDATYFAYILCVCVSSVSCCIDPLVYYYASSQCQRHLRNLLCCKKASEAGSSSSSGGGQPMIRASKLDTCSSDVNNSIYKKLLT
ncbi:proteinase-activated receptor 1 [Microcaecilia unicolor]|uniref:Proteinase-activated receptor 1 n=1 Tax=Microcaecilia unicolor TaxID=1415580 RepID=A0A6P7X9E3_9AMPH|nr:proteinase-activated receptor 1 [Microcaecilia unicolor]